MTCRFACRTSAAGGLAVLVAKARTLDQIRQAVVERVWLSSFDRAIDLPGLQRRLGARSADPTGAWLTVGVDDVQDRDLLAALHAADWQRFGVGVVATEPSQLADEMARRPRPPAEERVELFTRAQLRRFLASHSLPAHDLPEDVAELLCTPIFADLYRGSFLPGWRPTNEYELMDGFWRRATFDTGTMADAQDDVVALEHAARQKLLPSGHFPWDAESALAAGLNAPARSQLVRTGVLRAGTGGYSVMHMVSPAALYRGDLPLMLEQMTASGFAIQLSNGRYEGAKPTGRFARPKWRVSAKVDARIDHA